MPATGSLTARRRELGSMLRSLRSGAGLTAEQVAIQLGFSRSKISRLENGQRGASTADILRLCDLYKVDEERRLRLSGLAAQGKQRAWWRSFSLPRSEYLGLESDAASISDYALAIVPGLLQIPDYARAIVRAGVPTPTPRVVEERVQVRMARQQLLYSEEGEARRFEAVLDESVLHRVVGDHAVMLAQLKQLLRMSELPNVTIRVIPYDAAAVPAGVNKFLIYRFNLPGIDDIVLIEELTGHRYLEQQQQVEAYSATFRKLTRLSADLATSQAMIIAAMDGFANRSTGKPEIR